MYRLIPACVFLIASQSIQALPDNVKLSTKIWPPYHYFDSQGELTGISVKHLNCSFASMGINLTIEVVPWSRAQQHTQMGISDGFFLLHGMLLGMSMQHDLLISLRKIGSGTP